MTTVYPGAAGDLHGGVMVPRVTFPEKLEKDISNILIKNSTKISVADMPSIQYALNDLEGVMFELLDYIVKRDEQLHKNNKKS